MNKATNCNNYSRTNAPNKGHHSGIQHSNYLIVCWFHTTNCIKIGHSSLGESNANSKRKLRVSVSMGINCQIVYFNFGKFWHRQMPKNCSTTSAWHLMFCNIFYAVLFIIRNIINFNKWNVNKTTNFNYSDLLIKTSIPLHNF